MASESKNMSSSEKINETNEVNLTKKRKFEGERNEINKDNYNSNSNEIIPTKKRKFFNLFNGLFDWIINKNSKVPFVEIEYDKKLQFLNFNNVLAKHFNPKFVFVTDDSIGKSENILTDEPKGWITRRRRDVGHEWMIVRFKVPCIVYGIELDFENIEDDICPHLSIEAVDNGIIDDIVADEKLEIEKHETTEKDDKLKKVRRNYTFIESYKIDNKITTFLERQNTPWMELLQADAIDFLKDASKKTKYFFKINDKSLIRPWTHMRVNLYPDGGINKINLYGEFVSICKLHKMTLKQNVFLNKPENGCTLIYYQCNEIYKGHPKYLIDSHKTDGFCTKRLVNRPPILLRSLVYTSVHNISIFKLGMRCIIENFTIDIGNYKFYLPECIQIHLLDCKDILSLDLLEQQNIFDEDEKEENRKIDWFKLPPYKLNVENQKTFYTFNLLEHNLSDSERTATHFKVSLHPDGGISQINVLGTVMPFP